MLLLAYKYLHDPEEAMVINANLGGDTVHRCAVLGAILGAIHGIKCFPEKWMKGLANYEKSEEAIQKFATQAIEK